MSLDNARTSQDGSRWYSWPSLDAPDDQRTDVLSVTTVRNLCGMSMHLHNWSIANVVNAATGTRRVDRIGPRGGVKTGYEADGPAPGEFGKRLLEANGEDKKLEALRRWLRESAEHPRDIAAMRGSITHAAIETDTLEPDDEMVQQWFIDEGKSRKRTAPVTVTDDDIRFVQRTLQQYRHFNETEPGRILAREIQIWNLDLGYAGSLDVIREVEYNGQMVNAVLDYKTSAGTYTDQILQCHGYLGGQFVGSNGVVDDAATALLASATHGGLVHLRPDGWSLHLFEFSPEVMQAFVGSVFLARLLADHPEPDRLFNETRKGRMSDD